MKLRLIWLMAVIVAIVGASVAMGATGNPWSPYPKLEQLRVRVVGQCDGSNGSKITAYISGLTPLGTYHWVEWGPDGKRVSYAAYFPGGRTIGITPKSRVALLGDDCKGVPGEHRFVVTDNVTNQHIAYSYGVGKP